jgi:hypothetical protein
MARTEQRIILRGWMQAQYSKLWDWYMQHSTLPFPEFKSEAERQAWEAYDARQW